MGCASLTRPVLALVSSAMLLAACGPSPASLSPSASVPPSASVRPSASVPEPSAEPSTELVLRLEEVGDVSWIYPVAQLTVLADGRVITSPAEPDLRWSVRRLSADGVARLIATVEATGLFHASATYPMQRRPDAPEPPGMGGCESTITLGGGPGAVVVGGTCWYGDELEATYNVPSPERRALSALSARLRDLSWLEAAAWSEPESSQYEPEVYLLISTWSLGQYPDVPDVADVTWPFQGGLDEFGQAIASGSQQMIRCGEISPADAAALHEQLTIMTGPLAPLADGFSATLNRAPDAAVELHVQPQLPDGFPACEELRV